MYFALYYPHSGLWRIDELVLQAFIRYDSLWIIKYDSAIINDDSIETLYLETSGGTTISWELDSSKSYATGYLGILAYDSDGNILAEKSSEFVSESGNVTFSGKVARIRFFTDNSNGAYLYISVLSDGRSLK